MRKTIDVVFVCLCGMCVCVFCFLWCCCVLCVHTCVCVVFARMCMCACVSCFVHVNVYFYMCVCVCRVVSCLCVCVCVFPHSVAVAWETHLTLQDLFPLTPTQSGVGDVTSSISLQDIGIHGPGSRPSLTYFTTHGGQCCLLDICTYTYMRPSATQPVKGDAQRNGTQAGAHKTHRKHRGKNPFHVPLHLCVCLPTQLIASTGEKHTHACLSTFVCVFVQSVRNWDSASISCPSTEHTQSPRSVCARAQWRAQTRRA